VSRKPPRWTIAFLRALERIGAARAAAVDAGIDHSTAYARRRAHAEFAAAWEAAVAAHKARVAEEERAAIAAVRAGRSAPHPSIAAQRVPPSPAEGGAAEMAASGGQMKRVNEARWSKAAELRFFATLADTANVQAAADAAGFSTNAIYARRLRHPLFREQWAAAVDTGRARIELGLIEIANLAIERAIANVPDQPPQVSVQEALQILKLGAEPNVPAGPNGRRRLNAGAIANSRVATNEEIADALAKRLARFAVRKQKEKKARGQQQRRE
jgi:hypothetical protein